MDGTNSVHSVKPKTTQSLPRENNRQAVEPLTPLHRLARFKAIRDRNLNRPAPRVNPPNTSGQRRASVDFAGNSYQPLAILPRKMATTVNGVPEVQTLPVKNKTADKLTNGKDTAHRNGVDEVKTTNGVSPEPATDQKPVKSNAQQPKEEKLEVQNEPMDIVVVQVEKETASDGEGSSLDVNGESSSVESLDLQLPGVEEPAKEPEEASSTSDVKPPTPEIVKRFRAGGEIKCRPKRNFQTPVLKRKIDGDIDDGSSAKRSRYDGTAQSPGWQFFSPSKIVNRLWTPSKSSIDTTDPNLSDASMTVNFDDRSRYFDTAPEPNEPLGEEVINYPSKPANKWCSLM